MRVISPKTCAKELSALGILHEQFRLDLHKRIATTFPGASPVLIESSAEEALKISRKYHDVDYFSEEAIRQALLTTLRHSLPYPDTLKQVAAMKGAERLDGQLYRVIKRAFAAIARAVAEDLSQQSSAHNKHERPCWKNAA